MKRFTTHAPSLLPVLLTAAALVVAIGLSSCSRSGVTDNLTGPSHGSAGAFDKGPGNGGNVPPPPPAPAPPPAANPCTNLTGFAGTVTAATASVPQNRAARLRIEITGDTPAGTINKLGACSTNAAPTVSFISGRGTVTGGGVSVSEAFGAIAQVPGEPGVLVATNANGDVLEIIWPALSGAGPGAPIFRYQLARSGQAGGTLSVTMTFNARTTSGTTATFTASASGLVIPALR